MNGDALRGHLELLLLAELMRGEAHGYALIERLTARSSGTFELAEGSVYPALHRLEKGGFVTSSWVRVDGRRRRIYRLTRQGRAGLGAERKAWRQFAQTVDLVVEHA
jgi:PadR family transcriptional regulator PadR